jgi:hypothetical protein
MNGETHNIAVAKRGRHSCSRLPFVPAGLLVACILYALAFVNSLNQSATASSGNNRVSRISRDASLIASQSAATNPCPRFQPGSLVTQSPDLFSQDGVLTVDLNYYTAV